MHNDIFAGHDICVGVCLMEGVREVGSHGPVRKGRSRQVEVTDEGMWNVIGKNRELSTFSPC